MRVIVSPIVRIKIKDFYQASMTNHPLLSEETVMRKMNRMLECLEILAITQGFKKAQYNRQWIVNGWRELIVEDFHFAFDVVKIPDGERVVIVRDVVHSLLYR